MYRTICLITLLAASVVLLAACGSGATETPTSAAAAPTATTGAQAPTATTAPGDVAAPTNTPGGGAATPTATPTAAATEAAATATPVPTPTEAMTAMTPEPTATLVSPPAATATPAPAPTATATPTPAPTATVAMEAPTGETATVTLTPSKDNTLYESGGGTLSNGAGDHLFAGKTNGGQIRRALLAFDVAGSVPAGARITGVVLSLNLSRTTPGAQTVSLHRLLADWGEANSNASGQEGGGAKAEPGDATWVHRFSDSDRWSRPGGDYDGAESGSAIVSGQAGYEFGSSAQMVADVQGWVDDSGSNFGWILVGEEAQNRTTKRFDSRESGASVGPKLEVSCVAL